MKPRNGDGDGVAKLTVERCGAKMAQIWIYVHMYLSFKWQKYLGGAKLMPNRMSALPADENP